MKVTIHYSVTNCGDGSAYPRFFWNKELADVHQEAHNDAGEGWGEHCTGSITLELERSQFGNHLSKCTSRDIEGAEEILSRLEAEGPPYHFEEQALMYAAQDLV